MIVSDKESIFMLWHETKENDVGYWSRSETNCETFDSEDKLLSFISGRIGTDRPIKPKHIFKLDCYRIKPVLTEYELQFDLAKMKFSLFVKKQEVKEK